MRATVKPPAYSAHTSEHENGIEIAAAIPSTAFFIIPSYLQTDSVTRHARIVCRNRSVNTKITYALNKPWCATHKFAPYSSCGGWLMGDPFFTECGGDDHGSWTYPVNFFFPSGPQLLSSTTTWMGVLLT